MLSHVSIQRLLPSVKRHPLPSALLIAALLVQAPAFAGPAVIDGAQLLEVTRQDAGWLLHTSAVKTQKSLASVALPLPAEEQVHAHDLLTTDEGWLLTATASTAGTSRLIVLQSVGGEISALPAPQTTGRVLLQPTLLKDGDQPSALLWIEGPSAREAAVRAARWSGGGWTAPEEISPQGPGTQIALDALRLDDGSLLAVWAAHDGDDDEIVWSRSTSAGTWSAPLPISANRVPDVTPALVATEGGALVAWSAYDGNDYRIFLASFDGKAWGTARQHGERGSVFPSFAPAQSERPVLVFKQTAPAAWRVSRVRKDGSQERTLSLPHGPTRPLIVEASNQGITLKAAGEKSQVTWSE